MRAFVAVFLLAWIPESRAEETRTGEGFLVARPGYAFEFPRDHGSHPKFRIEWWYLTGHLEAAAEEKERFGFQATFFRRAVSPGGRLEEGAIFGSGQVYLAHMALLRAETGEYVSEERLNREGWDAGAATGDLDVRNGSWRLRRTGEADSDESMVLEGSVGGEARFSLRLRPERPLVIFGENGVSRKGEGVADASHYITFPRLAAEGELDWRGEKKRVEGRAWMDHEISSSQLGEGQVGWDWACLQLKDGRDVMVYRMRTENGDSDPYSRLTWIGRDGELASYGPDDYSWKGMRQWTSPETGASYPIDVELNLPDPDSGTRITFRLRPLADGQEIAGPLGGVAYWEGACDVVDEAEAVVGEAFVELTGYDGRLRRMLRK